MAIEAGKEVEILVNDVSMVFGGKDRSVTALRISILKCTKMSLFRC